MAQQTVKITQDGIQIDPDKTSFRESYEAHSIEIQVISNGTWTVAKEDALQDWYSFSSTSVSYTHLYSIGANVSYVDSKIINDNQAFQQYDYLYTKGNRVGQKYGLEVTGIFQNQMEINNSPVQTFSTCRPGDLKYKMCIRDR